MAKMIIEKTDRAVGILVSALFQRQIVLTLTLMFIVSSTFFLKILSNLQETLF